LTLTNVWDVAGARVVVAAGAQAVATASYAMSATLGLPDGEGMGLADNLAIVARIVAAVDVPVTADLERGYGETPDDVAASVASLLATGAVGCNLEDSLAQLGERAEGSGLRSVGEQVDRLRAARAAATAAGVPLVINARTDVFARGGSFGDTVARGLAYLEAGADCVFALGVRELSDVTHLARAFDGRLNVIGRPGQPSIRELADAGVCRISIGSSGIGITYAALSRAAARLLAGGEYLPDQSFTLP
jgi:2-methylisocitrate lyase-like PEP mutase family enzyme